MSLDIRIPAEQLPMLRFALSTAILALQRDRKLAQDAHGAVACDVREIEREIVAIGEILTPIADYLERMKADAALSARAT